MSPPYSGSTLLNEIISGARTVSVNNPKGTREGQQIPILRSMMFEHGYRFDRNHRYDWQYIKTVWLRYWDLSKPILLEKSPSNIARIEDIDKNFTPAQFIIFFRNPYAVCESLINRHGMKAERAAKLAITWLELQKDNINFNTQPKLTISYEELTQNPELFLDKLRIFVPEVGEIQLKQCFSAHNFTSKPIPIQNLNDAKIAKLNDSSIKSINSVFDKYTSILDYFGYQIVSQRETFKNGA